MMKMSQSLFDTLKADCEAIADSVNMGVHNFYDGGAVWDVFHKVCRDRSYDDTHPGFTSGTWNRTLKCNRKAGNPYLDQFYKDEDLNDDHIKTALRRIFPNVKFGK